MLSRLVEASLRYKFLVLIAFLVIAALGARAFRAVPIDAFPDVTPAQVNIYTESPGLAAEDVEQLLTFPIESAMAGLRSSAGLLQAHVATELRLKRTPTLTFVHDDTAERGMRIERLIADVAPQDEKDTDA